MTPTGLENDIVQQYHWHGDLPGLIMPGTVRNISRIFERAIRDIDETF